MEKLKYIVISMGWDGMPIAYKLQQEGLDVVVGQVESKKELGLEDDEKPEDRAVRLKQYDDLLHKLPARKLVDALKKVEDKDQYFIFCDQNNLFVYAEELKESGFTKGLFPTKEDFDFEKDREAAMEFVRNNYPGIQIIPHEEFATVAEAVAFLKGSQKVYVIQSKGDFVSTMVPQTDDVDSERDQMINHLEKNKADFERGGIILKDKLIHPVEITPQIVFYNGQPVFTDIDFETKNIGDGENNGNQVGCGSNLIIKTDIKDKINDIAFPTVVYEMALERTGMFVWDISIYVTDMGMFFGEFCSNRLGYDACMTEMDMSGGADAYFSEIANGQNPLKKTFGAAVRLFNLSRQTDREVIWKEETDPHVWMYEVYGKDDKILSLGGCWDIGVVTGSGVSIAETVECLYEYANSLSFKELYKKTKHDFLDTYPTSILFRFMQTNHRLFEAPDYVALDTSLGYEIKLQEYETKNRELIEKHAKEIELIKGQLADILNEEED